MALTIQLRISLHTSTMKNCIYGNTQLPYIEQAYLAVPRRAMLKVSLLMAIKTDKYSALKTCEEGFILRFDIKTFGTEALKCQISI